MNLKNLLTTPAINHLQMKNYKLLLNHNLRTIVL